MKLRNRLFINAPATVLLTTMAAAVLGAGALAQTPPAGSGQSAMETTPSSDAGLGIETFHLRNVRNIHTASDIANVLRIAIPKARIQADLSQAVVVKASPEDLATARKVITDLDVPQKSYRLTYTFREMDGSRQIGIEHYSLIVVSGEKADLKEGSRIPIATGSSQSSASAASPLNTEFQYIDIGTQIEASLDGSVDGGRLQSKVEQSAVAETATISGTQEPVIRQTTVEGSLILTPGKPLILGTANIPDSTRHKEIEVTAEEVH